MSKQVRGVDGSTKLGEVFVKGVSLWPTEEEHSAQGGQAFWWVCLVGVSGVTRGGARRPGPELLKREAH